MVISLPQPPTPEKMGFILLQADLIRRSTGDNNQPSKGGGAGSVGGGGERGVLIH